MEKCVTTSCNPNIDFGATNNAIMTISVVEIKLLKVRCAGGRVCRK